MQQDKGDRKSMTDVICQPLCLVVQTPSVHESAAPQFQVTCEDERSGMVIEICVGALRTVRYAAGTGEGHIEVPPCRFEITDPQQA